MKNRLGTLLYFDIVVLIVIIKPVFWAFEDKSPIFGYMSTLCRVAEVIFFLPYLLKKDSVHKTHMTAFDVKLWRMTERILCLCTGAYILTYIIPNMPKIIFLLFYLNLFWYLGVQIYFLLKKKW